MKIRFELEALNTNVMSMGTISNAAVATESYVTNVGKAATSADAIAASFTSAQSFNSGFNCCYYKTAADAIISSGQKLLK